MQNSSLYCRRHYEKYPGRIVAKTNKWRHDHLLQFNAGFAARRFVPLKDHCEVCQTKESKLERIHLDYARPLEVLTACRSCHKKIDRIIRQYGFKETSEPNWNNHHCNTCSKMHPVCGRGHPSFAGRGCMLWSELPRVIACKTPTGET